jgi:hypothetical protein
MLIVIDIDLLACSCYYPRRDDLFRAEYNDGRDHGPSAVEEAGDCADGVSIAQC